MANHATAITNVRIFDGYRMSEATTVVMHREMQLMAGAGLKP